MKTKQIMGRLMTQDSMKYSYNDVMIKPAILSSIRHRAECSPYQENGKLPLFTAPMDSVVNVDNFDIFEKNGINAILPRTEPLGTRLTFASSGRWAAFSMQEFEAHYAKSDLFKPESGCKIKALIDIANGHIDYLYELVRNAKKIYGNFIEVMVGNIANPETYRICVESRVDYVRCSVGTGAGCITCSNTGIGYPIASLISEIAAIKEELIDKGVPELSLTKIVADGGIRNYSDIIKAIALGADYVMCGSIFARMLESAAYKTCNSEEWFNLPLYTEVGDLTDFRLDKQGWFAKYNGKEIYLGDIKAKFYGMASKAGQIAMNGKKVHTSEGIEKTLPVMYTISTWVENFVDYIRSAMSYTNSKTLLDLQQASCIVASNNTYNSINK